MVDSRHATSIHILDDDSLLNVFYLYRPFLLDEDDDDEDCFKRGKRQWVSERWWHHLTHVLPEMAKHYIWVSILPGSQPCLYKRHTRRRHAGTFTSPSTRHRIH
jgi:hypothetical protein